MKRFVVAGLVIAVVLAGFPMAGSGDPGAATTIHEATVQPESVPGPSVALQLNDTDGGDNETERHRNPDDSDGEGDEEAVVSWLSGRLAGQLGEGAIQISEGQYELARDVLGDDYDERLEQFVEVTGGGDRADTFREAGNKQEELADLRQEFEETRAAYEQAIQDGDTERARELARELVALADQIEDVSADLEALLAEIESISGEDLSEVRETIEQVQNESTAEATEVAEQEFVETELVVDIADDRISFLDPAALTGQIQTADGEMLANEAINLTVGNQSLTAETGPDGEFSLDYRPTGLPLSADTLSVAYVPDPDSVYLGSETNVSVSVTQVEPSLDIQSAPETVSFGETVTVSGDLTVEGIGVDSVPVTVSLGGGRLGTTNVRNGSFETAVEIPASVPTGEQELTVSLPFENRALAGVAETQVVTVAETDTSLSVTASQVNGTALLVNGELTTDSEAKLGGESIALTVEGERVGAVTTNADGSFAAVVPLPDGADGETQVVATFDGVGSNLAPTRAETTITVGQSIGDTASRITNSRLVQASLVVSALLVLLAGILWYREDEDGVPTTDDSSPGDGGSARPEADPQVTESLFDHATAHLESGDADSAVQASYSAVRRQFEATIDAGKALTHWEFYRAYLDAGVGSADGGDSEITEDALRDLTEAYERAVYSPGSVQIDDAARTVERARRLCARTDGGTASTDGGSVRAGDGTSASED